MCSSNEKCWVYQYQSPEIPLCEFIQPNSANTDAMTIAAAEFIDRRQSAVRSAAANAAGTGSTTATRRKKMYARMTTNKNATCPIFGKFSTENLPRGGDACRDAFVPDLI
jgi:hypothetical protein